MSTTLTTALISPAPARKASRRATRMKRSFFYSRALDALQNIDRAKILNLPELEIELAAETSATRPRRPFLTALSSKVQDLRRRRALLEDIAVTKLLEAPITKLQAAIYLAAADTLMLLAAEPWPAGVMPAREVTRAEAEAWLSEQPAEARLRAYSLCGFYLYLGEDRR